MYVVLMWERSQPTILRDKNLLGKYSIILSLKLVSMTHSCPHMSGHCEMITPPNSGLLKKSNPMEVIDDFLVLFLGILSVLWQHFLKRQSTVKKKDAPWENKKTEVLLKFFEYMCPFVLNSISTMHRGTHWVEYYAPRCTQLNSK